MILNKLFLWDVFKHSMTITRERGEGRERRERD